MPKLKLSLGLTSSMPEKSWEYFLRGGGGGGMGGSSSSTSLGVLVLYPEGN